MRCSVLKNTLVKSVRFGLLIVLLICSTSRAAETTSRFSSGLDTLEQQLEMGRHEQLVAVKNDPANVLEPFSTDGCSGGLSVGWEYLAGKIRHVHATLGTKPPWESCCILHDRAYHTGGPRTATAAESFAARKKADRALQDCVLQTGIQQTPYLTEEHHIPPREAKTLYSAIAALMYRAVRIGGMPCTELPWRWGYGWPECK